MSAGRSRYARAKLCAYREDVACRTFHSRLSALVGWVEWDEVLNVVPRKFVSEHPTKPQRPRDIPNNYQRE